MRFIVMGDIHGNYYALEAAIFDALSNYGSEIDGFIFAGDYVGDFPDGDKVVNLMMNIAKKNKTYIIKGNREESQIIPYLKALEEGKEPDWGLDTTMGAALLSCRDLSKEQLSFLATLPDTLVIREPGVKPLFIKHKMGLDEKELEMVNNEKMTIITAHTHEANEEDKNGIKLYNPGSIGLSDEGIPGATYGILESDEYGEWNLTIRDVTYDFKSTIDSLKANKDLYEGCCGWGKVLELSVLTGINFTALYSFEANRIASIIEEAETKNIKPNESDLIDLKSIFSQGRSGNVNYDSSELEDEILEDVGDAYVFGKTKVKTSKPTKGPKPTEKIYNLAFNNIQRVAQNINRERIFEERHESIEKNIGNKMK